MVTIALNLGPAWVAAAVILLGAQILVLRAVLAAPNEVGKASANGAE